MALIDPSATIAAAANVQSVSTDGPAPSAQPVVSAADRAQPADTVSLAGSGGAIGGDAGGLTDQRDAPQAAETARIDTQSSTSAPEPASEDRASAQLAPDLSGQLASLARSAQLNGADPALLALLQAARTSLTVDILA